MRIVLSILLSLCLCVEQSHAQDSIATSASVKRAVAFGSSALFVGSSFLYKQNKVDFQALRTRSNQGIGSYVHWDDVVQFVPLAACYGMKIAGVPSRSQWGRMVGTHALATGMMMLITRPMKSSIYSLRPNSTHAGSFPSGHTATAFMLAGFLHNEYNHVSPWISVGGYAMATATGIGRIVHNRHWVSDVLCGAGIGILSTELAYLAGDLILGRRFLNDVREWDNYDRWHRPSFVGINYGFSLPVSRYSALPMMMDASGNELACDVKCTTGSDASLEGAYFFTPHWGLGGTVRLMSNNVAVRNATLGDGFQQTNCDLSMQNFMPCAYGSYPLSRFFRVQGKLGIGYSHSALRCNENRDGILLQEEGMDVVPDLLHTNQACHSFVIGTGFSMHVTPTRRLDTSIYADWNFVGSTGIAPSRPSFNCFNVGLRSALRL